MLLSKFMSFYCLHYIIPKIYCITEVLIFYADKLMVMGNSKNLRVFNFAILFKSRNCENLMLTKYTCFTVFHY